MVCHGEITEKATLPTPQGVFSVRAFSFEGEEHLVVSLGVEGGEGVLVRIHSSCLTGDSFESLRCDCRLQLSLGLEAIAREGRGILIYLNQEGRGIGLLNKIRAYALQDRGLDTVEANRALGLPPDARDYRAAAWVLRELGVRSVRLLTNNPEKVSALERAGISVQERVPLVAPRTPINERYLEAKKNLLGHLIE